MSILYYVPIIHPIEDYGSLGPAIKNAFTRRVGESRFNQLQKEIYQYWQITEERINKGILCSCNVTRNSKRPSLNTLGYF